jgi:hypothetical protein
MHTVSLHDFLAVDFEGEVEFEVVGSFAAQQHTLHKYLEIVDYGTYLGVDL